MGLICTGKTSPELKVKNSVGGKSAMNHLELVNREQSKSDWMMGPDSANMACAMVETTEDKGLHHGPSVTSCRRGQTCYPAVHIFKSILPYRLGSRGRKYSIICSTWVDKPCLLL